MNYKKFLETKFNYGKVEGMKDIKINNILFDFQKQIVNWACKKGRAAIFADTGLGKTFMQLEFAKNALNYIDKNVIIFAPLAVNEQTIDEAKKLNIQVDRYDNKNAGKIIIANYENLDKINPKEFDCIILDESSILKSVDSKTRMKLISLVNDNNIKYRLACTATPAPNDISEIANHTEFLGIMKREEMLSKFFFNNGDEWVIKGHGVNAFYKWIATWAMFIKYPSDLGFEDNGFKLPKLNFIAKYFDYEYKKDDLLFSLGLKGIEDRIKIRKQTIKTKVYELIKTIANNEIICYNVSNETNGGKNEQKGIYEAVSFEKYGQVGINTGGQNQDKQEEKIFISDKQKIQEQHKTASQEIPSKISRENKINETKSLQDNFGTIQGTTNKTGREMSDLRAFGYDKQRYIPDGRPLSQNRKSEGIAMSELQSRIGKIRGQYREVGKCDKIFENQCIIWCGLDIEEKVISEQLTLANIPFVVVSGKTPTDIKIININKFKNKQVKVMLSKPKVLGFGLNFQNCNNVHFFGMSDSYESYYQCIRRCYRFGQKKEVNVYIWLAGNETEILENVKHKEKQAELISREVIKHVQDFEKEELTGTKHNREDYKMEKVENKFYTAYLGDSCEVWKKLPDNSIDFMIFSPPFASLYTYSSSERDLGNCQTREDFFNHFNFLIKELHRTIKPGRLIAVHCMNLPTKLIRDGFIGITDFRGDIIRAFQKDGMIYHAEVCIQKNPQVAAIRTHAKGLMFKQMHKDSSWSRMGLADYVCVFKKSGDNEKEIISDLTNDEWIKFAHPIWTDIRETNTLNSVKAEKDEKHICPLQLDVIERCIRLWSNKGEIVASPFGGIGSEGYEAILHDRKALLCELKKEYFEVMQKNLQTAIDEKKELFG